MNENVTVNPTEKINKSKLIVAAFKAKGLDTPANDVVDFVKSESGIEVGVSLVNNLRHRLRKAKADKKAKRKPTDPRSEKPTPAAETVVDDDPLAKLFAVKEFAAKMGGLTELKNLVSKLEALAA